MASMKPQHCDILIIGAGVIGLTLARALRKKGHQKILILEKESRVGCHASGRNSGVLHAGIYYPSDTLKAKLCLEGNRLWRQYCQQHKLPVRETGKIVVTQDESTLANLMVLHTRGTESGAKVSLIDETDLKKLEPLASTYKKALLVHDTAVVDPTQLLRTLEHELTGDDQVEIRYQSQFLERVEDNIIRSSGGNFSYGLLINTAGAYSDRIAHALGAGKQYRLLPFKGLYKRLSDDVASQIHHLVYPVPNLKTPFLGVHATVSVSGEVYLGPTALPAFGPENYTLSQEFSLKSLALLATNAQMFFKNAEFRRLALTEPKRAIPYFFYQEAKILFPSLKRHQILPSKKVGIRPQLVNWETKELVMDFVVEKKDNHIHILNAISPAFTSAMAFADFVVDCYCK